jgi:hypothetical protein
MTDHQKLAAACKLDEQHLNQLIAMKKLAGKSPFLISYEIAQLAAINSIIIPTPKETSNVIDQ